MEQWKNNARREPVIIDLDTLVPKDHLLRKIEEVTAKHEVKFVTMDEGYKTPWIAKKTFDDGRIPILPYTSPPERETATSPGTIPTTPYQHVNVIHAGFCFNDLHLHLIAELSQDLSNILANLLENHFSTVLRCEYDVILTPITGMCCMLYLVLHCKKPPCYLSVMRSPNHHYRNMEVFIGQGFSYPPLVEPGVYVKPKGIQKQEWRR